MRRTAPLTALLLLAACGSSADTPPDRATLSDSGASLVMSSIDSMPVTGLSAPESTTIAAPTDSLTRKIDTALPGKARVVERPIDDESAEGGQLTAFFIGDTLKRAKVDLLGESGRLNADYHFENDHLVRAMTRREMYNAPIGTAEHQDGRANSVVLQFYYFSGDSLRARRFKVVKGDSTVAGGVEWTPASEVLASARRYVECARASAPSSQPCPSIPAPAAR